MPMARLMATDPDDLNACVPVAIGARCPLLTIDKSHTGNFATVTTGLYTIQVQNTGQRATTASTLVVDTLPTGMSFHSFSGSGWNLVGNTSGPTITWSNNATFAPGVLLPTLLLTVSIASDAPGIVINTVSVTTTNNAGIAQSLSADTTMINGSPDADGDGVIGIDDPDDNNPCVPNNQADVCDRDSDGLNNGEEAEAGTDPDDPDTDNDGVLDGDDPAPLNPCIPNGNADACPTGLGEWNFYFPEIDAHKDLAPNAR